MMQLCYVAIVLRCCSVMLCSVLWRYGVVVLCCYGVTLFCYVGVLLLRYAGMVAWCFVMLIS